MKHNRDDEIVGFFPRKRLVVNFLVVTMMLVFGTAFSVITVCNIYFEAAPETEIIVGWLMIIIFGLLNVQVTRGSFLCAKILRYYALALALICAPALFLADNGVDQIYSTANMTILFGAFYLMGGTIYQELVQYKHDQFADMREVRDAIEKEMKRSSRQGKMSKKR